MIPSLFAPINPSKTPSFLQRSLFLATSPFHSFPFSPMESFTLLKFWKPSAARVSAASSADKCLVSVVDGGGEEEESFFELEFTKTGRLGDFISGEKAEAKTGGKPQSPMSILKQSAPKIRVFFLGKLIKKPKAQSEKTDVNFTVKKQFARSESSSIGDGASRRFSKDSVNKYFNLIKKPLKRPSDVCETASFASPRKSEDRASGNGRFRAPCKNLGKSRSAGALLVGVSSPMKDDSLAQQNDGIQGAILHCKQSFSSSSPRERRVMSRSASDTSHDKSTQRGAVQTSKIQ